MTVAISKSALKPKLLGYLRMVEHNKQSIIVTDRGRPVAQILPFQESKEGPLDELKGSILHYTDPMGPVGLEDWELKL